MASTTGITSISAEFSVGSATSKTMISMTTSQRGIAMVTTGAIRHVSGVDSGKRMPSYSIVSLRHADPRGAARTVGFIRDVLKEYTGAQSWLMYWYSLTHPATLAYMVLLGGLLFQYGISKAVALAIPPVLTYYAVKARLSTFDVKQDVDLVDPSRYYNERKRVLFVAAGEVEVPNEDCCDGVNSSGHSDPTRRTSTTTIPEFDPYQSVALYGAVLGTVAVDTASAGSTAVVRHLCVDPKYRRLGIGQELLSKVMAFCEKERFQRVVLSTNNLQGPAMKLVHKNGFRPIHETVDLSVLPGVDITRTHFVRCLRERHTSSCCR